MMDAGKKIGELLHRRGQLHRAFGGPVQQPAGQGLDPGSLGPVGGEQRRDPLAQCRARAGAKRHQRVQRRAGRRLGRAARFAGKQPRFERSGDVKDHIADRDAAAGRAAGRAEHSERQVLDRKLAVAIGRSHPAVPADVVGLVDGGHDPSLVPRREMRRSSEFMGGRRAANDCRTGGWPRGCSGGRALMVRVLLALWHVVGLVLAVVLVTEYGVEAWRRLGRRLRYGRPHRPDRTAAADAYRGAEWAAGYFDEFHRAVRVDWRAYVEWWQRPVAGAFVTIDARGLRPTPGEESAAPDAVRILCFGGSTMMGMGARDAHTIPAMLARRLCELGHRVAVTNYGQLGHNTTQETIT